MGNESSVGMATEAKVLGLAEGTGCRMWRTRLASRT